eukprot:gene8279-biopygen7610
MASFPFALLLMRKPQIPQRKPLSPDRAPLCAQRRAPLQTPWRKKTHGTAALRRQCPAFVRSDAQRRQQKLPGHNKTAISPQDLTAWDGTCVQSRVQGKLDRRWKLFSGRRGNTLFRIAGKHSLVASGGESPAAGELPPRLGELNHRARFRHNSYSQLLARGWREQANRTCTFAKPLPTQLLPKPQHSARVRGRVQASPAAAAARA